MKPSKLLSYMGGGWLAVVLGVTLISNALQLMKPAMPTHWSMARRFRAAVSFMDRVWNVCLSRAAVSGVNVPGTAALSPARIRAHGFGRYRSQFSSA